VDDAVGSQDVQSGDGCGLIVYDSVVRWDRRLG